MKKTYIIGIDEAWRGPWAGPIVVGGWMAESSLVPSLVASLSGLTDSKLLTHEKRENLFSQIELLQHRSECQYAFSYRDADIIDELGIREANRQCMQDVILSLLQFVDDADAVEVYIDGCDNYRFDGWDGEYIFAEKRKKKIWESSISTIVSEENESIQASEALDRHVSLHSTRDDGITNRTIHYLIHGDSLIPAISAASIVAKVLRDRMMCDFHEDFPEYGFDSHKGYGTRKHQEALLNYGITPIHRKSYAPVKTLISCPSSL